MFQHPDCDYDPASPEFLGEIDRRFPKCRLFSRLWLSPDGHPRGELLVTYDDGTRRKYRCQLHEVETNEDD